MQTEKLRRKDIGGIKKRSKEVPDVLLEGNRLCTEKSGARSVEGSIWLVNNTDQERGVLENLTMFNLLENYH